MRIGEQASRVAVVGVAVFKAGQHRCEVCLLLARNAALVRQLMRDSRSEECAGKVRVDVCLRREREEKARKIQIAHYAREVYALRAYVRPLKAGELLLGGLEDLVRACQQRRTVSGVLPVFVSLHLVPVLIEQVGKVYRHCFKLLSRYISALKPACVEEAVAVVVRAPQQAEKRVDCEPRREQPHHQRI